MGIIESGGFGFCQEFKCQYLFLQFVFAMNVNIMHRKLGSGGIDQSGRAKRVVFINKLE